MGVMKYLSKGKTYWMVDETLTLADGREHRLRKRMIPSRAIAEAFIAKARAEAFEGRFFEKFQKPKLTVKEAWAAYEPVNVRDNTAWQTEAGRMVHVVRVLGDRQAAALTIKDVDEYRTRRLGEVTRRGEPPAPATLDREVELLKRTLNYAVSCGRLTVNPLAAAKLLRRPNVRKSVVDDEQFERLLEASDEALKPIILIAYDAGMRLQEVLKLRWAQLSLKEVVIRLAPDETKGGESRLVILSPRVLEALRKITRRLDSEYVLVNPKTGKPWADIKKMFRRALLSAGLNPGIWFHDFRRSFVTNARRAGVPESVVMRMSGHRTRRFSSGTTS